MIPAGTATCGDPAPRDGDGRSQRRQAFVDAAREAFFRHGYGATTMSSVAATVGGSKTTLWANFRSKEELFAAVVDDIVARFSLALAIEFDPGEAVAPALTRFGRALMTTLTSPHIIALYRMVIGEAGRFPELGALFYERGPQRGKTRLAGFFAAAMADGRLRPGDAAVAARQFAAMCQAGGFQRLLVGMTIPSEAVVDEDLSAAIDTFLRAWGA